MAKSVKIRKKEVKVCYSRALIGSLAALFIILALNLLCLFEYSRSLKQIYEQSQVRMAQVVENLQIQVGKKSYSVVLPAEDKRILQKTEQKVSDDYMKNYYEVQSNWLNVWLTILAITLAVLGIITPICFMKLYEDKKKEMDKIIAECKEQKEKTKTNVADMEEQLKEVKGYVDKAQKSERLSEANSNLSIAINHIRKDEYGDALKYLDKAIELNPEAGEAYFQRGFVLSKMKKCENAIADYSKALELGYDKRLVLNNRGTVYADLGAYDKAYDDLSHVVKEFPSYTDAWNNLSAILVKIGKYKEAINAGLKGLKLELPLGKFDTYYNLIEAYIMDKQFDKALENMRLYVNSSPEAYIYVDDIDVWKKGLSEMNHDSPEYKEMIDIIDNRLKCKNRD